MQPFNVFQGNLSDRKPNADEVIKDGLIYCKQCGTPRETDIVNPLTGRHQKMRCMCKCQQVEHEAESERMRYDENQRRIERARRRCFGDMGYQDCTFADDDQKDAQTSKRLQNYAVHFAELADMGQGLILFGGVGTGKSYHSACVANALLDRGYTVVMASVPSLVSKIQRTTYTEYDPIGDALKADLLILDDLGAERGTEYVKEQVYALVDGRYASKRPMIVSTNLDPQDLTKTNDITLQRIYSRIIERCYPIKYSGQDRRFSQDRSKVTALLDS